MLDRLRHTHAMHQEAIAATDRAQAAFDETMTRVFGDRFQMSALLDFLDETDPEPAPLRAAARRHIRHYLKSVSTEGTGFRAETGDRRWCSIPLGKTRRHRVKRVVELAMISTSAVPCYAAVTITTPTAPDGPSDACAAFYRVGGSQVCDERISRHFARIIDLCVRFDPLPFTTAFTAREVSVAPVSIAINRDNAKATLSAHDRLAARTKLRKFAPEDRHAELISEISGLDALCRQLILR